MFNKWLRRPNFKASTVIMLLVTASSMILFKEYLEIGIHLPI